MEVEGIPNGSQTIIHPAEEGVVSNLKHFRGRHLPLALCCLASHFQELFGLCQHDPNLHPPLCYPGSHGGQLPAPGNCAQSRCAAEDPCASTHLPGNAMLLSLGETSPSGFHLPFRDLLPGVRGFCTAEPPPCLAVGEAQPGHSFGYDGPSAV